jgi:hypothetical protein
LLLHPDTAHSGGPNRSYEIRKMVYFRFKIKCENDLPPSQRRNKNAKKESDVISSLIINNDVSDSKNTDKDKDKDSCVDKKNDINYQINKLNATQHTEEYEKKEKNNDNYPIFEDWKSVTAAHTEDMWADLMGVKTLG